MNQVEMGLHQAIEVVRHEISETKIKMENVSATEGSLDSKIEKRKMELERNQKRLQTLKKVRYVTSISEYQPVDLHLYIKSLILYLSPYRPAFMEEFERLEIELRQLYESYVLRFRCVNYLEQQYESAEQAEQERMEERQVNNVLFLFFFSFLSLVVNGAMYNPIDSHRLQPEGCWNS